MKAKIIILPLLAALLMAFSFSCATVSEIGAGVLQATGFVDANQAEAIKKTGVAWGKTFEQITPEQEYYIGRAVAANVLSMYKIDNSKPKMVLYINKICNALLVNSPRPEIFNGYHVNILDSDEINAFATPGGHIFLTRAIIATTSSEDTLAAVIAHEISHIQLEHGLKAIKNSRITQALTATGSTAVNVGTGVDVEELAGTFGLSVDEIVTTMVTKGYSRSQEYDADSTAMALMSLAGYEPSSLVDMLKVLEKNQGEHPGGFNKTHPTPAQRITNAQKTAGKYKVPDTRSFRTARFSAL